LASIDLELFQVQIYKKFVTVKRGGLIIDI